MHRNTRSTGFVMAAFTLAAVGGCQVKSTSSSSNGQTAAMSAISSPEAQVTTTATAPQTAKKDGPKMAADHLQKPGFAAYEVNGRLWILRSGSTDLAEFLRSGEPAKSVTRPGAGPGGMTIRAVDAETIDSYLTVKHGFETFIVDGRLWVFRADSSDLAEFHRSGEPAKSVTRPGAGPRGMTIRAVDAATIDEYLLARPGFATFIVDGRLWVFRAGSSDLAEFHRSGEPAKSVTRPGAGPRGMSVRAVDAATIDAYLALVQ